MRLLPGGDRVRDCCRHRCHVGSRGKTWCAWCGIGISLGLCAGEATGDGDGNGAVGETDGVGGQVVPALAFD